MTPKIAITGLHKRFGPKQVLKGVDLSVEPGQSLVVIGGSGSGKSVLLKCILGLLPADSGSIQVDGEEVVGIRGRARERYMQKFGMLFQGGALFDSLTVWENISFAVRRERKLTARQARDLAIEKLGMVGLSTDVANLSPSELSGGMQKRVSLARAIARDPEIIFFDEPTTGLDPIMADVINELIIRCTKQLGSTTITITHDMHSARRIADRVAMIYQGSILWDGKVADIDTSGNAFVDQFIHGRAEGPIQMEVRKG
jgi:phospholipid/cholesterol/gamma-HCH transport system ATP-binding protein